MHHVPTYIHMCLHIEINAIESAFALTHMQNNINVQRIQVHKYYLYIGANGQMCERTDTDDDEAKRYAI